MEMQNGLLNLDILNINKLIEIEEKEFIPHSFFIIITR